MRSEDSDLLAKLHQSWAQTPPWAAFLRVLSQRLGASMAVLRLLSADGQAGQTFTYGADEPLALSAESMARMRYLRIYSNDDIPSPANFRALRTKLEGGGEAWLIVQRAGGDFAAVSSVILTSLAPHIAVAAPQFFAASAAQIYAQQMDRILVQQELGWVLLAPAGSVVAASAGLGHSMTQGSQLKISPIGLRRVLAAVQARSAKPVAWEDADLQYLITVADQPHAVLYLQARHITQQHPHSATALAVMLGLTPTEARFAMHLAQGRSIAQAGDDLSLSLETARYYSKQIYSKLGLSSQTAVVRRVENSVLRLL
jgi:DNA-binding CsgD family transcriptional regulator